jgi:hypothetical protein
VVGADTLLGDSMNAASPKPERVTLSREYSDFLVELSIALHKHAIYPTGHPSLGPAAAGVTRRAERLLEDRPVLAFGVARRQLIIEGVATDPNQPVLRRLADGLHRHHLGAISFSRGLQPDEIASALQALSADVERDGPLGLAPRGRLREWPHVRLHPLTFDRLELVSDAPVESGAGGTGQSRVADLWIGLARAAMASDERDQPEAASAEPAVVAKAIDEHRGQAAYDQVIVGYLLQIAHELKSATGVEAAALRRRTARLVGALRPETLRRLVEMGGDAAQRRTFVLEAASGMAVDAVLEILKAAADASGQTISHGLVRMLSKLAAHAELGREEARPLADSALREQVERLLSGWQLADPNPDAYGKVLQHLATSVPARTSQGELRSDSEDPLRIVQMSLEVGGSGPLVDRALDRLIDDGAIGSVLNLAASLPPAAGGAAEELMARLVAPSSIAALVAWEPLDVDSLDQLLPVISLEGYEVLLDALVTSVNRSTRRKLLDRLAHTQLDVGALIAARLEDERWYVQRNMLVLLQHLGRLPPAYSPMHWTRHRDARVRYEAIQLQLTIPAERDLGVRTALEDSDLRIMRLGLTTVQDYCPPSLVPLVVSVALRPKVPEELRVVAIRALGRCRDPRALEALLQLADGGRTMLGRPKLAPGTPACLAALRALSQAWSQDPRAAALLALAVGSSAPEVRQAVARSLVQ